jgi:membrane fusion protein, heavy metal efflux system
MNNQIKFGLLGGGMLMGLVIGFCARADGVFSILQNAVGVAEETAKADEADAAVHENLELSEETCKSMGLKLRRLKASNYVQSISVPAMIVEKPGHSGRTIPSRVHGVVTRVHCVTGQLVHAGDDLFEITLTGDALVVAQTSLLTTIQELENERKELARVSKLVEEGSIIGSQKIPIEYEVRRLENVQDLRHQELLVRGLTDAQVQKVIESKKLISKFTVKVPLSSGSSTSGSSNSGNGQATFDSDDSVGPKEDQYTIESIDVHPGQSISPGDRLAHLAWHNELYIKGFAFERDLRHVADLKDLQSQVSLEIGETGNQKVVDGFDVHFIDNHVDPGTGAFHFYLELKNTPLSVSTDNDDRVFKSWTYRPGQRLHVRLPVEEFSKQFVLPVAAIVKDGAETYVYRRLKRHHVDEPGETAGEHNHVHLDEFQRVTVKVLHRDAQKVVIADNGELKQGDLIAQNRAYQLYAAQQAQAGKGGGGHSHAGHSH